MLDLLSIVLSVSLLALNASGVGASTSTQTSVETPASPAVIEAPPNENKARAQIIDLG